MSEEKNDKCPLCEQELNDTAKAAKVNKENLKSLYNKYYEGRDYHLKRFWENSIFVWTFLMVCFTAYGLLMNKYLDEQFHDEVKNLFPIYSSFICVIGFILSVLWYKMAKASKAWYEVYESAIWEMESLNNEFGYESKYLIHNFWDTKDGETICSPSKIVIAIGALLMSFWIIAFIFGIWICNFNFEDYYATVSVLFGFITLCIFFICEVFCLQSSTLRDEKSKKAFRIVKDELNKAQIKFKYVEVKNMKGCTAPKIWVVLDESMEDSEKITNFKRKYEKIGFSVEISKL